MQSNKRKVPSAGGDVTYKKYGSGHFSKLAKKRWALFRKEKKLLGVTGK